METNLLINISKHEILNNFKSKVLLKWRDKREHFGYSCYYTTKKGIFRVVGGVGGRGGVNTNRKIVEKGIVIKTLCRQK